MIEPSVDQKGEEELIEIIIHLDDVEAEVSEGNEGTVLIIVNYLMTVFSNLFLKCFILKEGLHKG